jgi:hypothetical protein
MAKDLYDGLEIGDIVNEHYIKENGIIKNSKSFGTLYWLEDLGDVAGERQYRVVPAQYDSQGRQEITYNPAELDLVKYLRDDAYKTGTHVDVGDNLTLAYVALGTQTFLLELNTATNVDGYVAEITSVLVNPVFANVNADYNASFTTRIVQVDTSLVNNLGTPSRVRTEFLSKVTNTTVIAGGNITTYPEGQFDPIDIFANDTKINRLLLKQEKAQLEKLAAGVNIWTDEIAITGSFKSAPKEPFRIPNGQKGYLYIEVEQVSGSSLVTSIDVNLDLQVFSTDKHPQFIPTP